MNTSHNFMLNVKIKGTNNSHQGITWKHTAGCTWWLFVLICILTCVFSTLQRKKLKHQQERQSNAPLICASGLKREKRDFQKFSYTYHMLKQAQWLSFIFVLLIHVSQRAEKGRCSSHFPYISSFTSICPLKKSSQPSYKHTLPVLLHDSLRFFMVLKISWP